MGRVSDAKERLMVAVLELICSGSYGTTTIDSICDKAGVKKGSFYYFFDSKTELAVVALQDRFDNIERKELDSIFSPTIPPLDRIRKFCQNAYDWQKGLQKQYGRVLGCPLHCLGAEVSTQEPLICAKIQEIMGHYYKYLASAIRDAHDGGVIEAPDPASSARMLFAYYEGLLTQARIQNSVEVLREMEKGTMSFLGLSAAVNRP